MNECYSACGCVYPVELKHCKKYYDRFNYPTIKHTNADDQDPQLITHWGAKCKAHDKSLVLKAWDQGDDGFVGYVKKGTHGMPK